MSIHARVGGVWQEVNPFARVGGNWLPVQEAFEKSGGTWRRFYLRFSASIDPGVYNESGSPIVTQTRAPSVATEGGVGPYAYSWSWVTVSGDGFVSVTGPTSANPVFSASYNEGLPTETLTGYMQCVFTDLGTGTQLTLQSVPLTWTTN